MNLGVPSFKFFAAYKNALQLTDTEIIEILEVLKE